MRHNINKSILFISLFTLFGCSDNAATSETKQEIQQIESKPKVEQEVNNQSEGTEASFQSAVCKEAFELYIKIENYDRNGVVSASLIKEEKNRYQNRDENLCKEDIKGFKMILNGMIKK